ncbi:MAG: hypothetical protein WCP99_17535, partial [Burkholderiales bacterium]
MNQGQIKIPRHADVRDQHIVAELSKQTGGLMRILGAINGKALQSKQVGSGLKEDFLIVRKKELSVTFHLCSMPLGTGYLLQTYAHDQSKFGHLDLQ